MSVLVVDYGMGNLASVARAIEDCGADPVVSDDPASISAVDRIVVPGVGGFFDAMQNLRRGGWVEALRAAAAEIPLLGICLGMQLLAGQGDEGGATEGLGLIPGSVQRLVARSAAERIPHVGWNSVDAREGGGEMFEAIASGTDFYFVHSYHFVAADDHDVLATSPHCGGFTAVVRRGHVVGSQFHPEKSSRAGRQFLRNFLKLEAC